MKLLHTSDWHVGKTLKGRSRLDEQKAVLAEIVQLAIDHEVDAVLIAGDVYENVSPPPRHRSWSSARCSSSRGPASR